MRYAAKNLLGLGFRETSEMSVQEDNFYCHFIKGFEKSEKSANLDFSGFSKGPPFLNQFKFSEVSRNPKPKNMKCHVKPRNLQRSPKPWAR